MLRLVYPCTMSISGNLRAIHHRIEAASTAVKRDPATVTLIAVSKMHTVDEIREAYDCGQRHFGESRLQEAQPKIQQLPKDIVWHYIGTLQTNKAKKIASLFHVIHTFCKASQIEEASKSDTPVDALIEVNIANEPQKAGISTIELDEFHQKALNSGQVHFRGLMTIGPVVPNAEAMRPYFRELRELREKLRLEWLSMGMSGDFEVAIQEGASHIRVGTAIFGSRL